MHILTKKEALISTGNHHCAECFRTDIVEGIALGEDCEGCDISFCFPCIAKAYSLTVSSAAAKELHAHHTT